MKKLSKTFLGTTLMLLAAAALLPGVVSAGSGNIATVSCTNDISTDRALIQAAINNAGSGDTLMLVGTCQLDGTRVFITKSNLTITGVGAAGNWSTVVQGIASGSGTPVGDGGLPSQLFFNRGFQIGDDSGNSQVQHVLIENIKFSTLHRGVLVSPQIGGDTLLCSGTTVGTGSASSIVVANNWFDNDDRSAQVFGAANQVTFQNNLVTNGTTGQIDFLMEGQIEGCNGGAGFVSPIGVPENSAIVGNSISGGQETFPILVTNSDKITVAKNILSGFVQFAMILLSEDSNSQVSNNQINGGFFTIFATDFQAAVPGFPPNSSHVQISNNRIGNNTSNVLLGVVIDTDTTGYSVVNNVFSNDFIADILLCGTADAECDGGPTPSFDNTVVTTNFGTTVINDGSNNQLLGTQKLLNNTQVPPGVTSKLIGRAAGRPQQ